MKSYLAGQVSSPIAGLYTLRLPDYGGAIDYPLLTWIRRAKVAAG